MTTDRLKEIRERAEKATKGPWRCDVDIFNDDGEVEASVHDEEISMLFTEGTGVMGGEDCWTKARESQAFRNAEFIAHAREDVPFLLAELEKARAALGAVAKYDSREGYIAMRALGLDK